MPFDLDAPPPQPEQVELAAGVTVKVAPLTGAIAALADAEVATAFADLRVGGAAGRRFYIDPGKLADPRHYSGLHSLARLIVIGGMTIQEWSVMENGKPAPVSEDAIARLFLALPDAYYAFREHQGEAARRRAEAGEAYAASLTTPGEQAANTAGDASRSPLPAAVAFLDRPDATAPPSSMPLEPERPSPSGGPSPDTPGSSGTQEWMAP